MKHFALLLALLAPSLVSGAALDDAPTVPYDEAALLPIRSPSLRPGPVAPRAINLPGITALFLIGDDPRSHAWLQQRLPELQRLGAAGLVVNVESAKALQALRLGLNRYPVLITATAIEQ